MQNGSRTFEIREQVASRGDRLRDGPVSKTDCNRKRVTRRRGGCRDDFN